MQKKEFFTMDDDDLFKDDPFDDKYDPDDDDEGF